MAPELLRNECTNNAASDVYSFGIMLYEVYSRKEPYEGQDIRTVLKLVCDPIVNLRPPVPDACPPVVSELMRECLESRPDARPAAAELDARLKQLDVDNVKPGQMIFSKQKKKEEHKTTDLLLDVFPPHIAEALREGRKIEPETRECVTILFSDIVGFTSIAASLSPLKVSDMLDRLYLQFDELTRKHDLFKVETIGDAYMCAGNLVKDQQDHAKRIAEFAADAIMIASETEIDVDNPRRGYIKLRIGFHSGPVVTNVVGSCNLRFSLFGDTVNTASRMESTSEPGRIHCSERAAKLLQKQAPEIPVKLRGTIDIKGKGEMVTYWVNEVHQGSDTDFLLDTEFVVSPMAGELVKLDVERDVSFVSHSNRRSPCTRKTGRGSIAEESERPESKQSFEDLEALENGDSGFLNRADKN
jgi:class 3 adenylate cyclase